MKIIFNENINKKNQLSVAKTAKSPEELYQILSPYFCEEEKETYFQITNNKRKQEWLAVRLLLFQTTGKYSRIYYDNNGKPFVKNTFHISISHSNGLIALLISDNPELGVDVELLSERILLTAHKFTDQKPDECQEKEMMINFFHLTWSAKETLYKIYSKGIPNFIKNLKVDIPKIETCGTLKGTIDVDNFSKTYKINYRFINLEQPLHQKFIITWSF